MIAYFDTSAFVPMFLDEDSSEGCRMLWGQVDAVLSTRLLYIEAVAAIAQAVRLGRVSADEQTGILGEVEQRWSQVNIVELDEMLMLEAAEMADTEGLRGYDAVHCAAGLGAVSLGDAVLVSGDVALLEAWQRRGAMTIDVMAA